MDIAVAFFVIAFLILTTGVALLSIPAGLIVAGLLLGAAGVALIPTTPREPTTKGR